MSSSDPGILGATGFSYAMTVMVDQLNIFSKPLAAGHLSSCFLLPYLANEPVVTIYLCGFAY
jgi:hypothetical protein